MATVTPRRDELLAVGRAVLVHPELWPTAVVAGVRHLPGGWWRGPTATAGAEDWLRFRVETAYGADGATPTPEDVVTWLRWCRDWPAPPAGTLRTWARARR